MRNTVERGTSPFSPNELTTPVSTHPDSSVRLDSVGAKPGSTCSRRSTQFVERATWSVLMCCTFVLTSAVTTTRWRTISSTALHANHYIPIMMLKQTSLVALFAIDLLVHIFFF